MAFRSGNRRNFGGGGGGGGYGGGSMGRNMNPWDQNQSGGNYGNMRQGGGGGGQGMSAEALTLANNLLNNLLRNQNPPSLLDLPRGGNGSMNGNRGNRQVGNRAGGGNRNRRMQGGFGRGQKSGGSNNKQGGGIRKQNAFDRAKKLLAKNSNKNKKDSTSSGDKTDKKRNESLRESIYADVPNDMFYCHLCKKHMWDSNSFENHIKGRTHLMMREGIEESYRLKANMIRQEAKIAEQLKLIELDRLKRMGKSGKAHQREYCTMCDLNFHGHLSAHRKSDGHLTLKKFLHPKCVECNKEFPTRIEYDTHLLTPEHLKKAAERNTKVGERKRNTLNILTEEDELKDVKQPSKKKKRVEVKKEGEDGEAGAEGGQQGDEEKKENGEATVGDDATTDGEKKEAKEDGGEEDQKDDDDDANMTAIEDPEDCILDYHDGDEIPVEIDLRIPKYNWQRPVGTSLIDKLECFECCLCGKFFDTEKTSEVHSRTVYHHRQFVKFINEKSSDTKIAQKRAAAAIEESERKKRRLEEEAEAEKAVQDEEMENGDAKGETDADLYDPSEATADDDVEMNDNAAVVVGEGQESSDNKEEELNSQEDDNLIDDDKPEDVSMNDEVIIEEESIVEIKDDQKKEVVEAEQKKAAEPATTPKTPATTPVTTPQQKATPQKTTPSNRGGAAKGTPRGRGRGRYNRY